MVPIQVEFRPLELMTMELKPVYNLELRPGELVQMGIVPVEFKPLDIMQFAVGPVDLKNTPPPRCTTHTFCRAPRSR